MIDLFTGILSTAFLAGGVLALGALGEVLAERVGVINLGLEGLMALGGISAIITVSRYPVPTAGLLVAIIVGLVFGSLFAAGTVLLRANQTLCGLALTILGSGLAAAVGRPFSGQPARATFDSIAIPLLSKIPVLGESFFSQNLLLYIIWIVLPILIHWLLFSTRHGINMRAVGESPAAADAVGIPVTPIRFCYVTAGASLAAAAGGYLTLAFVPSWSDGIVAGRGWIAVALVIFAGYRPYRSRLWRSSIWDHYGTRLRWPGTELANPASLALHVPVPRHNRLYDCASVDLETHASPPCCTSCARCGLLPRSGLRC